MKTRLHTVFCVLERPIRSSLLAVFDSTQRREVLPGHILYLGPWDVTAAFPLHLF